MNPPHVIHSDFPMSSQSNLIEETVINKQTSVFPSAGFFSIDGRWCWFWGSDISGWVVFCFVSIFFFFSLLVYLKSAALSAGQVDFCSSPRFPYPAQTNIKRTLPHTHTHTYTLIISALSSFLLSLPLCMKADSADLKAARE